MGQTGSRLCPLAWKVSASHTVMTRQSERPQISNGARGGTAFPSITSKFPALVSCPTPPTPSSLEGGPRSPQGSRRRKPGSSSSLPPDHTTVLKLKRGTIPKGREGHANRVHDEQISFITYA